MMKSFNVDFNWVNGKHAPANAYAQANAAELAKWYQELGCNNFWTFAVSFNGYAWYDSRYSPKVEGLKGNFTRDCVIEGHKRGMSVFAYHNLASNPVVEKAHPEWARPKETDLMNLVFCDEYLDLFCSMIDESIRQCGYDGLVIDWFRPPVKRDDEWIPKEKEEFELLMGYPLPNKPQQSEIWEYEKRSVEKAWRRVKETVKAAGDIPIWTNQPFFRGEEAIWNGNILLKEADYLLNEGPDFGLLEWMRSQCGEHTQIVQNLCGWPDHDLSCMDEYDMSDVGLFGFAMADPASCFPFVSVEEAMAYTTAEQREKDPDLKKRLQEHVAANRKNIELVREIFAKM